LAQTETAPGTRAKPLALRKNFSWTFVGNTIFFACQYLMLSALAKLSTPVILGRFSLALAITGPVIVLATLNLRTLQATDVRTRYTFGDYISLRLATLTLAMLSIIVYDYFEHYSLNASAVILAVGIAKVFDAISDVVYGKLQQHERMERIAISRIIQGVLQFMTLWIVFYLTHNLLWASIGFAVASALVTIFYDFRSAVWVQVGNPSSWLSKSTYEVILPHANWDKMLEVAKLALPLGLVMSMGQVAQSVPRLILEHFKGDYDVGIFSAMFYSVNASCMVFQAIQQSATPRLSQYYISDLRKYKQLVVKLVLIGLANSIGALAVVAVIGKRLMSVLFKPEYATQWHVLLWLVLATTGTLLFNSLTTALLSTRDFSTTPYIAFAQVVVLTVSCWLLIPTIGLNAIPISMGMGSVVAIVLTCLALRSTISKRPTGLTLDALTTASKDSVAV
jgi:O-antigen/teichoic acid export membrane protein